MLKIIFGEVENAVYHPPTYFDNRYEDEWITEPLTVAMIKEIDRSDVVAPHLIQSPVLGPISTKEISGGMKKRERVREPKAEEKKRWRIQQLQL